MSSCGASKTAFVSPVRPDFVEDLGPHEYRCGGHGILFFEEHFGALILDLVGFMLGASEDRSLLKNLLRGRPGEPRLHKRPHLPLYPSR